MKTISPAAPFRVLVLLLAGCSAMGGEPLLGDPLVRGPVLELTHHATASALRVSAGPGSREACGIVATVDAATRYLRRDPSGEVAPADRGQVTIGDTVEVHVSGPVLESCPVQGYGATIVLVQDSAP